MNTAHPNVDLGAKIFLALENFRRRIRRGATPSGESAGGDSDHVYTLYVHHDHNTLDYDDEY